MLFPYLKDRAPVVGLGLAVIAIALAFSKRDLFTGLAILGGLAYFSFAGFAVFRLTTEREKLPSKAKVLGVVEIPFHLFLIGYAALPLVGLLLAYFQGELDRTWHDFRIYGAVGGAGLLIYFLGYHVPKRLEEMKKCPECTTIVHKSARICPACNYRWLIARHRAFGSADARGFRTTPPRRRRRH